MSESVVRVVWGFSVGRSGALDLLEEAEQVDVVVDLLGAAAGEAEHVA